ncbi:glycosyltransferase family 2 protein [Egbenema bharatensis]|uniref:glycosyltransferase family 2 protein n=1 Tax=Egbenema bharatensis TaxID=3463334 RepID=UPI003A85B08F
MLFIDADVRLEPGAIEAAVRTAEREKIDLLTCGPAIVCGCLAEWLVQPLMFSTILIGFNADAVNDPQSDTAFAAGPFMLFRRSAYEQIGGHRAVGDQVVEDVALAHLVKQRGLTLRLLSGIKLVSVRMYRSGSALWEGWTKNLFLASGRNLIKSLLFAALMPLIFTVPWIVSLTLLTRAFFYPLTVYEQLSIALSLITIGIHFVMRKIMLEASHFPLRYWWLSGVGGGVISAITLASIIKTETGWGWNLAWAIVETKPHPTSALNQDRPPGGRQSPISLPTLDKEAEFLDDHGEIRQMPICERKTGCLYLECDSGNGRSRGNFWPW